MNNLSPEDKTIHNQFSAFGKNAKEWMNKCILLLPKIEKSRIWQKKGFSCIYEYAAKIAGMSRDKVNEGLRILKKTENLPAIRAVMETKGVFAVKPVVNIATIETDQLWAKRTMEMKRSTLETFVKDHRKEQEEKSRALSGDQTFGRPGAGSPTDQGLHKPSLFRNDNYEDSNSKMQISMKLDRETADKLKKIKGEGDWQQLMEKLLKFSRKELDAEQKQLAAQQKSLQEKLRKELAEEKPATVKSNNHSVTKSIRLYIEKRSGGKCEHPNCYRPGKHIHHTEPFALKRIHDPDKLIHLCAEHHQIIHLGYIDDSDIVPATKQQSYESHSDSWKQIEKLPSYDIKNVINGRIAEFRRGS